MVCVFFLFARTRTKEYTTVRFWINEPHWEQKKKKKHSIYVDTVCDLLKNVSA